MCAFKLDRVSFCDSSIHKCTHTQIHTPITRAKKTKTNRTSKKTALLHTHTENTFFCFSLFSCVFFLRPLLLLVFDSLFTSQNNKFVYQMRCNAEFHIRYRLLSCCCRRRFFHLKKNIIIMIFGA